MRKIPHLREKHAQNTTSKITLLQFVCQHHAKYTTQGKINSIMQARQQDMSDMDHVFLGSLSFDVNMLNSAPNDNDHDWMISLQSNNTVTQFKMDTVTQANLLPMSTLERLSLKPHIAKTHTKLTAYNGINIPVIGKCMLQMHHKDAIHSVPFIVADTRPPPLLGPQTCVDLTLIRDF